MRPLREPTYGLAGSGNDIEFEVEHETQKAYKLYDGKGTTFWLPKACVDENGTFTTLGVKITKEKYRDADDSFRGAQDVSGI